MITKSKIFNLGKRYLLSFPDVSEELLLRHLRFPIERRPKSKEQLFRSLIDHAQNRQGMPNAIGRIDQYKSTLLDFDPEKVCERYESWESLFNNIAANHTPPGRMVKENSHNYWVIYCKAILSIAKYLKRFPNIQDFDEYIKIFITDHPDTRIALPLILSEELFGFRFALACDFLKENISPEFIKPDTHIRDIFSGLGFSCNDSSDFQLFRDVIAFSRDIGESPYSVDKLFWLIGSGNFYLNKIEVNSKKYDFIDQVKKEVNG